MASADAFLTISYETVSSRSSVHILSSIFHSQIYNEIGISCRETVLFFTVGCFVLVRKNAGRMLVNLASRV